MKRGNLPDDLESPNDIFFTHPVVEYFLTNSGTQAETDWDTFTGETIKDKFESLYLNLVELTNVIVAKGGKGYFWVVCSNAMENALEVGAGTKFAPAYFEQVPLGYNIVMHMGILDKRWRIYSDPLIEVNTILIGAGFSKKSNNYYCKLKVNNFVK